MMAVGFPYLARAFEPAQAGANRSTGGLNMARLVEYPWQAGPLQVSPDGRHLVCGGKPFFWLGDTAWLLTEKLSASQAGDYLENRAAKGFNVIQATLVHRFFDQVHYRSSGDA